MNSNANVLNEYVNPAWVLKYLACNMAQNIPEFREIFESLLQRDKYVPCPVQIKAAPVPNITEATYNNHVFGIKNVATKKLGKIDNDMTFSFAFHFRRIHQSDPLED